MSRSITIVLSLFLVLKVSSSFAQADLSKGNYEFTFIAKQECTPVISQDKTGTCWSFSTASYLESEHFRLFGKWIDLSEMYFVRMNYLLKGEAFLRYQGNSNFSEGSLSHDVMRIYKKFGAMPQSAYDGYVGSSKSYDHGQLVKELKSYLQTVIRNKTGSDDWEKGFGAILDKHLGPCPEEFEFEGRTYSASTFAKEVVRIKYEDYLTITSFSHLPAYEKVILQIPDNYSHGSYLNLPFEDFTLVAEHALRKGHTITWDCDVSEKGFSAQQGLAIVPEDQDVAKAAFEKNFVQPSDEKEITADLRQEEFDSYSLTDDHLMQITGLAKDQNGKLYYFIKNSWGDNRGFGGYLMASQAYMELNTIGLFLHRDALPESLQSKADSLLPGTP